MGALFFSTYGLANWLAARRRADLRVRLEHAIPFVPWTIVPYWSIDCCTRCRSCSGPVATICSTT
jgi:hypothetical protein